MNALILVTIAEPLFIHAGPIVHASTQVVLGLAKFYAFHCRFGGQNKSIFKSGVIFVNATKDLKILLERNNVIISMNVTKVYMFVT